MAISTSGKTIIYKSNCNLNPVPTFDDLPIVGASNTLYIVQDTAAIYIWDGAEFIVYSSGDYYTNSYVERLKALGSPVQYSNYAGGTISSFALTDGRLKLYSVFIPKTSVITNIGWRVGASQGNYTADEYNGVGIYSINNTTGDLTLLGKTTNDATIWSSVLANIYGNKDFESPITLEKGIYFLAYLYNSSAQVTAPTISVASNTGFPSISSIITTNTPTNTYLGGYIDAQIELPITILKASVNTASTPSADIIFYLS